MALEVFLSSTLRGYVKGYDPVNGLRVHGDFPISVTGLINLLKIPINEVKVVIVDGIHRDKDFILQGNERVGLFPAVGGG